MIESKNQNLTGYKRKKPIFEEKELGINPFIQSLKIKVKYLSEKHKVIKLSDIKLEDGIITLGKSKDEENVFLVEKHEKTQIYTESSLTLHINSMSPKAKSLYLWLIYEVDYAKDYIWLNVGRYLTITDTSLNTYKEALIELGKNGIITPIIGYSDMYWINPLFFFKGNRVNKFSNSLNVE